MNLTTAPTPRSSMWRLSQAVCTALLGLLLAPTVLTAQVVSPDVRTIMTGDPQPDPSISSFGNNVVSVTAVDRTALWSYSNDGGLTWNGTGYFAPNYSFTYGRASVCVDGSASFFAALLTDIKIPNVGVKFVIAVYKGTISGATLNWAMPVVATQPERTSLAGSHVPWDALTLYCDQANGFLYLVCTEYGLAAPVTSVVEVIRSTDGGQSWGAPVILSSSASSGGRAAIGPLGEVYVSWEDYSRGLVIGRRSTDHGQTFGPAFTIGTFQDNMATGPPGDYLITEDRNNAVYPCGESFYCGWPSLSVDKSYGPYRGRVYATWAEAAAEVVGPQTGAVGEGTQDGSYLHAERIEIGDDINGEATSSDLTGVSDKDIYYFDGTAGTQIRIDGSVTDLNPLSYASPCWWYGVYAGPDTLHLINVGAFLMSHYQTAMPPFLYTLPATGRYYIVTSSGNGPQSVDYRLSLRSIVPTPGQAARDQRDVVITSSSDGGQTWSPKLRVNDSPTGFDESLPSVAVDGAGLVHVAWYDRRDDTQLGAQPNTYWAYSQSGGTSFTPSRRLSTQSGLTTQWWVGDHLALWPDGDHIYCAWSDTRQTVSQVRAVRIDMGAITPVEVADFAGDPEPLGVRLSWAVAAESRVSGFRVHRTTGASESFSAVSDVLRVDHGKGVYAWLDASVRPSQGYSYKLEVLHSEGPPTWVGPLEIRASGVSHLTWVEASPNPVRTSVQLKLQVPQAGDLAVFICDVTGQRVAEIAQHHVEPGLTQLTWDGRDGHGARLPAGAYLCRAQFGAEVATQKLILVR